MTEDAEPAWERLWTVGETFEYLNYRMLTTYHQDFALLVEGDIERLESRKGRDAPNEELEARDLPRIEWYCEQLFSQAGHIKSPAGLSPLDTEIAALLESNDLQRQLDFLAKPSITIGEPISPGVEDISLVKCSEDIGDFETAMKSLKAVKADSGIYRVEINGHPWFVSCSEEGGMSDGEGWAEQRIVIATRRPSRKPKLWREVNPTPEALDALRVIRRHAKTGSLDWRDIAAVCGQASFEADIVDGAVVGTVAFGDDLIITGTVKTQYSDVVMGPTAVICDGRHIEPEKDDGYGVPEFKAPLPKAVALHYPNAKSIISIRLVIFEGYHLSPTTLDTESQDKLQAVANALRREKDGLGLDLASRNNSSLKPGG